MKKNALDHHTSSPGKKEPNVFGELLRKMIKSAGISQAAMGRLLDCKPKIMCDIISGKYKPTQDRIEQSDWRRLFAKLFPEMWEEFEAEFEKAVATLSKNKSQKKDFRPKSAPPALTAEELSQNWRLAVAEFVKHVLEKRGDELKDFVPVVETQHLQSEKIWRDILAAQNNVCIPYLRDALIELDNLYCLASQNDRKQVEAYHYLFKTAPRGPR